MASLSASVMQPPSSLKALTLVSCGRPGGEVGKLLTCMLCGIPGGQKPGRDRGGAGCGTQPAGHQPDHGHLATVEGGVRGGGVPHAPPRAARPQRQRCRRASRLAARGGETDTHHARCRIGLASVMQHGQQSTRATGLLSHAGSHMASARAIRVGDRDRDVLLGWQFGRQATLHTCT